MKKLINSPDDVVAESLGGMEAAHDQVRVDHANRVVLRSTPKEQGRVALISGGGSGHEPLHGGFVGFGMLDAACAGEVFTSPTPDQVLAAAQAVDNGAGIVQVVKNYTGDVMNFEMGAELAQTEGIHVRTVQVADDVAVEDSTHTIGRRGVGGTLFVEKILGAAAEEGRSLDDLESLGNRVASEARSMGVAISSVTTPAAGRPTFDLPDDEMEVGVGIHGEPGRHREPFADARTIAAKLVDPILADLDYSGSDVIVLLTGMGASPLIELYVMYAEVQALLEGRGVRVARRLVGNYVTSLDMAGCAVTLLRADDELLRLFDAPVDTGALRWGA